MNGDRHPLFKPGDLASLRSSPDIIVPVIEVDPAGPECRYWVFQNNEKVTYYESQLKALAPADEDRHNVLTADYLRARLTSLQILSPSTANLFSLRLGRIQFVPYQYRPVLKLIRADRPRLLIADEVGVGKTIEAGLVIKELRARTDISSVLVICPKPLVAERKWFLEMKRFDEDFTALDGSLLRHCLHETHLEGEWPDKYAKAILPFSLLDSDLLFGRTERGRRDGGGLLALDPPPKFDLVIVDEAHHIRNTETYVHQGVRFFCDNAQAVLFLTATPVQLGSKDLFILLNALRPDLVIDQASFERMAEPNPHINEAVRHCRAACEGWQREAHRCLEAAGDTEWGRMFLRETPAFQGIYDRLANAQLADVERVGLIREIEELYTFSPLLSRTRRRDIGEFTVRKPQTLTTEFTPDQKRLHEDLLSVVARILGMCYGQQNVKFLMTTIRRQAASCLYGLAPLLHDILIGKLDQLELMEASDGEVEVGQDLVQEVREEIEGILDRARHLDPHDPKVEAFAKVIVDKDKLLRNKSLVFSTFRHTLSYLAARTSRTGLRYGEIHGGIPDDERAELRRRFGLPKEDGEALDVLLSSEVACEGLDFQFCDLLVNYDLPWNPMRIEQRIGRIDRFGQQSDSVAVVNLITPGTVDAEIYERCLWRIGIFQHAVGGSEEILGEITRELHDIAEDFELTSQERESRLQQLADNGIRLIREEQELEAKQAELFGLSLPGQTWRQEIESAQSTWLSSAALQHCITSYLRVLLQTGAEFFLGEKAQKTLRLSQEARSRLLADYRLLLRSNDSVARDWERWLKGGQPTLPVAFEQDVAVENPKVAHLSVLHPLSKQAARFFESKEPVYVSLKYENSDGQLPNGKYSFALYRWRKHGVRVDESLFVVATDQVVESNLLTLLPSAVDKVDGVPLEAAQQDALDAAHHGKWAAAQANHIAENRQRVEQLVQSLTASHQARCTAIEDQLGRATNDRIQVMKQGELARANTDFQSRMADLERAANSGDIRATPVVFGTLDVSAGGGA